MQRQLLILLISLVPAQARLFQTARCFITYLTLGVDLADRSTYPEYFADDSVMTLAQAGDYVGIDAIAEYVGFAQSASPYFAFDNTYDDDGKFLGYNRETGMCEFIARYSKNYVVDAPLVGAGTDFDVFNMVKLFIDPRRKKVLRANVFYAPGFLTYYFGLLAASDGVVNFLCDVMRDDCAGLTSDPTDCETRLKSLPVAEGELVYADGNTMACRILHGAFASENPTGHCAHISFEPREDLNGSIKCQQSQSKLPSDLFSPEDMEYYNEYATIKNFDPAEGYRINSA